MNKYCEPISNAKTLSQDFSLKLGYGYISLITQSSPTFRNVSGSGIPDFLGDQHENLIQGFRLSCQTEGKSPLDLGEPNGLMSEQKQEED